MKLQNANELKLKKQLELQSNMHDMTNRVNEKLEFKSDKVESDYFAQLEKNTMKRKKIEDKKKTQAQEDHLQKEFLTEQKVEKLMQVKDRQQSNRQQLQQRNNLLEKRWREIKKRGTSQSQNTTTNENIAVIKESNSRRVFVQ